MIKAVLFVAAVSAPVTLALGLWAANQESPTLPVVAERQNAPLVTRPGAAVEPAARYLARVNTPPPPPPPPAPPAPYVPPPPPPPDPAPLLRRDVSAVLGAESGDPSLMLASRRQLRLGEEYIDGWRLTALTGQSATLTKGGETRNVNLFSPVALPQPAVADTLPNQRPGPQMGRVALSNSQRRGELSGAQMSQVLNALRRSGMQPGPLEEMRRALQGPIGQQQIMQLMMNLGRSGRVPQAELTSMLQGFASSGLIPQQQVGQLSQMLSQMPQNNQNNQMNQLLNQMQRNQNNPVNNNNNNNNNNNRGGRQGGVQVAPAPPAPPPPPPPPPTPRPPRDNG